MFYVGDILRGNEMNTTLTDAEIQTVYLEITRPQDGDMCGCGCNILWTVVHPTSESLDFYFEVQRVLLHDWWLEEAQFAWRTMVSDTGVVVGREMGEGDEVR